MSIYDSLNTEQKKAVLQTEGPVLILAGAGSGKTRVITHRIAWLIGECDVSPWNILAITFTNKAAGEMRERVDKIVGYGSESVWISTFHSMCVRMLRRHVDTIGYDNAFTIYDTDDQKSLIRQVGESLRIRKEDLREQQILKAISAAKNELMTPERYRDEHGFDFQGKMIADAYDEYQRRLRQNNAMDFDDLLMQTVQLFTSRPEILEGYQDRFHYIMVDEYQDTNTAQFELIRLLSQKRRNLCVVGDDDQSIYKFRGANIRNILDFEKVYPDAMVIKLEQNYRSTQNILDAANGVIHHNDRRKDKALWTDHGAGSKIHFRRLDADYNEADFIAQDIGKKMRADRKLNYRDFAVLYRTNAQSRLLEEKFILYSIPYNIVGGQNFYARMEVHDILSYLRVISNSADDVNLLRIINVPKRGIGKTTIDRVLLYAQTKGISMMKALEETEHIPDIGRAKDKLKDFAGLIGELRSYAADHTVEELIDHLVKVTEYEQYLKDADILTAQDRMDNIGELVSKAAAYQEDCENGDAYGEITEASLAGFLENVALVAEIDQVGEEDNRVLLMTLHSAKGLEFPHVYLAGMEENVFPGYMSANSMDPDDIEEERRLAYVGITRAMEDLTLTCAGSRMLHGDRRFNPVSRFVLEMPRELLDEAPGFGDDDWEDEPDERMPFSSGRGSTFDYDSFGSRRTAGNDSFVSRRTSESDTSGSRSTFIQGKPYGGNFGSAAPGAKTSPAARPRPKAVYVKPHTSDEKKPFIAKTGSGLDGLQKGMPAGTKPDYEVGDRVRHVKYGDGTVLELEKTPKDYKVKVAFDEAGQKVMYAAFAKLDRI